MWARFQISQAVRKPTPTTASFAVITASYSANNGIDISASAKPFNTRRNTCREAPSARPDTRRRYPLTVAEQSRLFDAFLSRTLMIEVYYHWRPNLPDEGDQWS